MIKRFVTSEAIEFSDGCEEGDECRRRKSVMDLMLGAAARCGTGAVGVFVGMLLTSGELITSIKRNGRREKEINGCQ